MNNWNLLQERIGEWSDERNTDLEGLINHLIEEIKDLKERPYNIMDYADVAILFMSSLRKAAYTMDELYQAIEAKHRINESRIWLDPDEDGVTRYKPNE